MKITLPIAKSLIKKLPIYQGKFYSIEDINAIFFKPKVKVSKDKTKVKIHKPDLKKECDDLWAEIIKLRAGYKSEISGREGRQIGGSYVMGAHHIAGKKTLFLRYSLENGICLENTGEHIYGIHSRNITIANQYKAKIEEVRGSDIYDKLNSYSNNKSKSLKEIKIYLENELKKLRG